MIQREKAQNDQLKPNEDLATVRKALFIAQCSHEEVSEHYE